MINVHFKYNALDKRLPNGLCDKCRRKLYHCKNGSQRRRIDRPDLNQFYKGIVNTRSTNKPSGATCACKICEIVGTKLFEKVDNQFRRIVKPFKGRRVNIPKARKICETCYSWIERGKRHKCLQSSRLKNLTTIVKSLPQKEPEQVISALLKDKVEEIAKGKRNHKMTH